MGTHCATPLQRHWFFSGCSVPPATSLRTDWHDRCGSGRHLPRSLLFVLVLKTTSFSNKEIMKKSNPKKVCWDVLQPQHFATYLWHYPTQSTPKRTELYPLCNRICLGGQVPLPKRKASKVLWFATVHWAKHAACVSQLLAWLDFQSEGLIERFRKKIQSFFRWKHMLVKKLVPRSAFCLAKVIPSKCWRIHLVLAICLKPDFETILFEEPSIWCQIFSFWSSIKIGHFLQG